MKKTVLRDYARLIVRCGANVQKGQDVLIYADLDQPEFVAMVVDEAYKAKARKVVVLMDTSKLDKSLPYTFCHVDEVHTIITDNTLPRDISLAAHNADVRVIVAR